MIKKTQIAASAICAIAATTLTSTAATATPHIPALTKTGAYTTPGPAQHTLHHSTHVSGNTNVNAKSLTSSSNAKPNWLTLILRILKWILGILGG